MTQVKKFVTLETGQISTFQDGKKKRLGNAVIGYDDKGRKKLIVNVGDLVGSAFLNKYLSPDKREKLAKYREQLSEQD